MLVVLNALLPQILDGDFENLVVEVLILSNDSDFAFEHLLTLAAFEFLVESNGHRIQIELSALQYQSEYVEIALSQQVAHVLSLAKGVEAELDELQLCLHHVLVVLVDIGLHGGFLGLLQEVLQRFAYFDDLEEFKPLREVVVLDQLLLDGEELLEIPRQLAAIDVD